MSFWLDKDKGGQAPANVPKPPAQPKAKADKKKEEQEKKDFHNYTAEEVRMTHLFSSTLCLNLSRSP